MDRRCWGWIKQLRWRWLALTLFNSRPTQTTLQVTKASLETTTQVSPTTIFIAAKKVTIIVLKIAITKIALRIVEEKKIIVVHLANEITITFKKIIIVQQMEGNLFFNSRTCLKFSSQAQASSHKMSWRGNKYSYKNNWLTTW